MIRDELEKIVNKIAAVWDYGDATLDYPVSKVFGKGIKSEWNEEGRKKLVKDLASLFRQEVESMIKEVENYSENPKYVRAYRQGLGDLLARLK